MPKLKKTCPACKKEFFVPPYRASKAIYCSSKCFGISQRGRKACNNQQTFKSCITCGKDFMVSPCEIAVRKNCSRECFYIYKGTLLISKETRKKMSKTMRKRMTPERRAKMSAGQRGKKVNHDSIKKSLRRRSISLLEKKFNRIIVKYGLPFVFVGNGKCFIQRKNPDFIHTGDEKVAIEVFWRKHKEYFRKMKADVWIAERDQLFKEAGWKTYFFDETQVNKKFVLTALKSYLP